MFKILADQKSEMCINNVLRQYLEDSYNEDLDGYDFDEEFVSEDNDDLIDLINSHIQEDIVCGYHPDESGTVLIADRCWFDACRFEMVV